MKNIIPLTAWILGLTSLFLSPAAHADFSVEELKAAGKTLNFIKTIKPGAVKVAIIYDAQTADSQKSAETLASHLKDGLKIKKFTLSGYPVAADDLSNASDADIFIIMAQSVTSYARISAVAQPNQILTITNDFACVDQGFCIMGIETKPKVSIVVSKKATDASNVKFSSALRLMVKER